MLKQTEHEAIVLQMLEEIKTKNVIFSGTIDKVEWLIENKMIIRSKLIDPKTGQGTRIRYRLTKIGEGLLEYIKEKHSQGKDLQISRV